MPRKKPNLAPKPKPEIVSSLGTGKRGASAKPLVARKLDTKAVELSEFYLQKLKAQRKHKNTK